MCVYLLLHISLWCCALIGAEIRNARKQLREGSIDQAAYEKRVNEYMAYAIDIQEKIGLDVLVHGEPERSDM